jgi:transposase-like protein
MLGEEYVLKLKSYCPYCQYENRSLYSYSVGGFSKYIFVGDILRDFNSNFKISFISAYGYCENCSKEYRVKVGVKNSRLTELVIII